MEQEILEIIASTAEISIDEIKNESSLVEDLEMDSLMIMDLIVKLEKVINQKIKSEDMVKIRTVNDVFVFVKERK